MILRPPVCAAPLFLLLIVVLGGLPLGVTLAEPPRSLLFGVPLLLAGVPFALNFARRLAWVWGARLELDERGVAWSRGARKVRIEWDRIARLSHGAMEHAEWLLEDETGQAISISGLWQTRGDDLRAAFRRALEGYVARMPTPAQTVVRPCAFDRSLIPAGIAMLALFLGPLAWAVATIPSEFVPPAAVATTWLVIAIGIGASLLGLTRAVRWRVRVTPDEIVVPYRFGSRTLRLIEATEVRHSDTDSASGLVRLTTTIVHPVQTVVLTSRQEGYFEARTLLSRATAR